ncbi:MAG: PHP domain-containing protein [Methylophilaceae bacterium]
MNIPSIDLHCHSTISDGILTPSSLLSHAAESKVKILALTDHDDIAGLDEARVAAEKLNIIFINGVEISVTWNKRTLHIIGLNFNPSSQELINGLREIRVGRLKRAELMAHGLGMVGILDAFEGAKSYAQNSTIGRIHFAQFIVSKGYAKDVKSVFKKYLIQGKPGYVSHVWATLEEAVSWIKNAGGDAVIAHPGRYAMGKKLYSRLMEDFKSFGGVGVEVMSGSQDPTQSNYFAQLANQYGLLASCGSDFHGMGISHRVLGAIKTLPDECVPIWTKWPQIMEAIH